jgi:hypothetical protein
VLYGSFINMYDQASKIDAFAKFGFYQVKMSHWQVNSVQTCLWLRQTIAATKTNLSGFSAHLHLFISMKKWLRFFIARS